MVGSNGPDARYALGGKSEMGRQRQHMDLLGSQRRNGRNGCIHRKGVRRAQQQKFAMMPSTFATSKATMTLSLRGSDAQTFWEGAKECILD